jgi:hypothetical protein
MPDSTNSLANKFFQALVEGNISLLGALSVSRAAVGIEATTSNTTTGITSVDAPGAGVAITSLTGLPAGTYDVYITTYIIGTTVAALEADNMQFRIAGAPSGRILTPVSGTSGASDTGNVSLRVNLTAPTTLSVNAVSAATAGSVYKATMVANKIGY